MRHLRITLGLAATVCSFAVAAAPALAHEFTSSGGASHGKGEEQNFHLGPFKIECQKAVSNGGATTPTSSETLFAEVKLRKCKTKASVGGQPITLGTTFKTPLDIEYHANGFVEIGSEGEEIAGNATLKGGEVEVRVHTIKCVIRLPEQTIPKRAINDPDGEFEAARYETVPAERGGKINEVAIENEFKGIHFEYGEGQCENFTTSEEERKAGTYTGELLEEIKGRGGNLEWN
jgi:hypothetical protein